MRGDRNHSYLQKESGSMKEGISMSKLYLAIFVIF